MSDATEDAMLAHLRERKAELERVANATSARLSEINGLIEALADGRTRVRRRLKEAPAVLVPPPQDAA